MSYLRIDEGRTGMTGTPGYTVLHPFSVTGDSIRRSSWQGVAAMLRQLVLMDSNRLSYGLRPGFKISFINQTRAFVLSR